MSSGFKTGDTAYAYEPWWGVCKVKIEKIEETVAWVHFECSVDKDGNQTSNDKHGGTAARFLVPDEEHKLYGLWGSAKEVYILQAESLKKHEDNLRNCINSAEDLIRFPLENCLSGEDPDYIAIKIYKEKAKELLDIDL